MMARSCLATSRASTHTHARPVRYVCVRTVAPGERCCWPPDMRLPNDQVVLAAADFKSFDGTEEHASLTHQWATHRHRRLRCRSHPLQTAASTGVPRCKKRSLEWMPRRPRARMRTCWMRVARSRAPAARAPVDADEAHGMPLQSAPISGKAVQSINVGGAAEQELGSDKKSVNVASGLNTYDSAGYTSSNSYREPSVATVKGEAEQPIGEVVLALTTAVKTLNADQQTVQKQLARSEDVMQHIADRLGVLESRTPSSAPKASLLAQLNAAAVHNGTDAAGKRIEEPSAGYYEAPKTAVKSLPVVLPDTSSLELRFDEAPDTVGTAVAHTSSPFSHHRR